MRNRFINTEPKRVETYKGLTIHADTGVHEQAAELVRQYVPAGSSVLDVGAGAGAFSRRLADEGYRVTALDVDEEKWVPRDIPFQRLDIDRGIAGSIGGQFDAVCCLEVIEHVENPWSLMRDIGTVLRPGGRALVSTPNVTSFLSRMIFLRSGRFHQFNEDALRYGHISPITPFEMTTIVDRLGLRLVESRPGGYLPVVDLTELTPRSLAQNLARTVGYVLSAGQKQGWCTFFVIEKPA